jgi:hypothetical protein
MTGLGINEDFHFPYCFLFLPMNKFLQHIPLTLWVIHVGLANEWLYFFCAITMHNSLCYIAQSLLIEVNRFCEKNSGFLVSRVAS